MEKRQQFLRGLAAVFELAEECVVIDMALDTPAAPWDSLNVMQTVVLIDDVYGKVVHGRALADCKTVSDIVKIAEGS